jgi:lipopolysaccharide/colanic/teichoic acid biosynthesis glycosyltransferase
MLKRAFDIILSGVAMIIFLPLLLPLALLLKLTGEGEIFYIQPRTGIGGEPFGLIKFATMLKNSPNLPGGEVTLADDPRVLPLGHFLRKTKLNELPQLWNIFKGEMSFVGPRPLVPASFACYPAPICEEIKTLRPGLTGIGSLVFRDEECIRSSSGKPQLDCYYEDILPHKALLELWYKENRSLWLDSKILFFTFWAVLLPQNRDYLKYFSGIPAWPSSLQVEPGMEEIDALS